MAITFVNAGAEGSAGSGNITLGAPASPQTDDVWIALIHSSDQVSHSFTDWTQIAQGNGGGTTSRISAWYFRYAGSTPNLVVTHTGGQSPIGGIAAYRGVKNTGSPVNVSGSISGGTDGSIEHSAITPTVANCALLVCNGSADDNARTALGGDYAVVFEDTAGGTQNCFQTTAGNPDGSVSLFHDLAVPASDTGTITVTQAAADAWASLLIALEPAAAVLNAGAGSYTKTGQAAGTLAAFLVNAAAGAYTLVGQAATFVNTYVVQATGGIYAITGQTAVILANRVLTLSAGAYSLTGQAATLQKGYPLNAGAGAYTVTGNAATLLATRVLVSTAGAYVYTGSTAQTLKGFSLQSAAGIYNLTGKVATVTATRALTASLGVYTITGQNAGVLKNSLVVAAAGVYNLTGRAATLLTTRTLTLSSGTYLLSGKDANLVYSGAGAYALDAAAGSYILSGKAAQTLVTRQVVASAGSYTLSGKAAQLLAGRIVVSAKGVYTYTGQAAELIYVPSGAPYTLSADKGSYTFSGKTADLNYVGTPEAPAPAQTIRSLPSGGPKGILDFGLIRRWFRRKDEGKGRIKELDKWLKDLENDEEDEEDILLFLAGKK